MVAANPRKPTRKRAAKSTDAGKAGPTAGRVRRAAAALVGKAAEVAGDKLKSKD